ncbi:MAG: D-alanine--poly(phosphoribitol) ligase subunit DltA [Sporolactobacillus sp.]
MDILNEIRKRVLETPEKICFIHREERLTYRQLEKRSDAIARWIEEAYPDDQLPIMVHGHMGSEMPVLFLACAKSGHAYIPVDLSIPVERISLIAASSGAQLIFTADPSLLPSLKMDSVESQRLEHLLNIYHDQKPRSTSQLDENATFYIIYTSGSTGKPKGVQIPRRSLESFVHWMSSDFGLTTDDIFLNQAPFSFDLSVMDLYPTLAGGSTLWTVDKEMIARPKELFASFAASMITIWTSTPSFAEMCLMEPSFSATMLPALHTFLFCGETLPVAIARKLHQRFPRARIINTYGPTETTVAVTSVTLTEAMLASDHPFPVGACKSEGRLLIMDPDGAIVPDGDKGEIVICGASVGSGYLGEPEKTASAFEIINDMPAYHTKDIGRMENGLLYYYGRIDHQIKLHGFRMELEEIEHVLSTCRYVKQALVIPVKKGERYDHLIGLIVPEESPFEATYQLTAAIRKELTEILPSYMIPRKFIYQAAFPMTANGKVNRKALQAEVAL